MLPPRLISHEPIVFNQPPLTTELAMSFITHCTFNGALYIILKDSASCNVPSGSLLNWHNEFAQPLYLHFNPAFQSVAVRWVDGLAIYIYRSKQLWDHLTLYNGTFLNISERLLEAVSARRAVMCSHVSHSYGITGCNVNIILNTSML